MNGETGDPTPEATIPVECFCTKFVGETFFTQRVPACIEMGDFEATREACEEDCDLWWQTELEDPETTCMEEIGLVEGAVCGVLVDQPCQLEGPSPSCSTFEPETYITEISSWERYGVDYALAGQVLGDYGLLNCGGEHWDANVGDGFTLDGSDPGDLWYELGLRDGDVPLTLNGLDLDTYSDVAYAFALLWLVEGETTYELFVERDSSPVGITYYLYLTSP